MDDDFNTPDAVYRLQQMTEALKDLPDLSAEEGRRVYAKIRRFLLYGPSGGAREIGAMLSGTAVVLPLRLLLAEVPITGGRDLPGLGGPSAAGDVLRGVRVPAAAARAAGWSFSSWGTTAS